MHPIILPVALVLASFGVYECASAMPFPIYRVTFIAAPIFIGLLDEFSLGLGLKAALNRLLLRRFLLRND